MVPGTGTHVMSPFFTRRGQKEAACSTRSAQSGIVGSTNGLHTSACNTSNVPMKITRWSHIHLQVQQGTTSCLSLKWRHSPSGVLHRLLTIRIE